MELYREIFEMAIISLFTGCGMAVIQKLMEFLNEKIDSLQQSHMLSEKENLNKYIDYAQQAVYMAVTAVTQTYVDNIKHTPAWNDAARKRAKTEAVELAKALITEDAREVLQMACGDFNTYLNTLIESTLNQSK